ncbi:MAG: cache domain-containing protein [Chloroflexota bacterium]
MKTSSPDTGDVVVQRRAFLIALILLAAILANLILSLSLGFQSGDWQQFARAGLVLTFGLVTAYSAFRIRRGAVEFGITLILGVFLATLVGTGLLLAQFGLALGLIEILLTAVIATQTLSPQRARFMTGASVLAALLSVGLDFLPLDYRVPAPPAFARALPLIAAMVALVFMTLIAWQALRGGSIRNKILVPVLAISAVILTAIVGIGIIQFDRNLSDRETERLLALEQTFNSRIDLLKDFSLALALEVANDPEVQEAFASQDRARLVEMTLPSYLVLDEEFDVPQYQFHLPPATSFLRLHQLDQYGDDLSSFRATVLASNAEKKPVAGIEIGRGGLGVRGVAPVSYQGRHIGTVEFGLNVDQTLLDEMKNSYGAEWQILLLKETAEIATFVTPRTDVVPSNPDLVFQASTLDNPIFLSAEGYEQVLGGIQRRETVTKSGSTYEIVSTPLYDFSGQVIGVIDIISDQTEVAKQQNLQIGILFGILLVTLLVFGVAIYLLVNRITRPIQPLTEAARAIAAGNLDQNIPVRSQDELGILAQTVNQMALELKNSFGTLEERVAARTRDLATVAEVGTATATILKTEQLLQAVVDLTKERFGLYHSHIYLLDEEGTNLVLAAGAGEAGQIMVSRGHSIPLDREQSLVARAARERKGVTVNDVTQVPDFLPNPLLPNTRSELAVPMVVGGRLIGVFDVQSDQVGRFTEADVNVQTTLAAQVATSVQNARFYEQSRTQADLEALINAIGQKIQRAATVEETLQTAIRELGTAVGAARVSANIQAGPREDREKGGSA